MNQLYFEGKVVELYAEDFNYLQENINSEILKLVDITTLNGLDSYISLGFTLQVSTTDNTKLFISQGSGVGTVISKTGIIIQSSLDIDSISLSNDTSGIINNVYCNCYQASASYNRQTGAIVEEKRAIDLQSHALKYNRTIDKFSIVVYTDAEYSLLSDNEKSQLVLLGSTTAQGSGQPLLSVDLSQVKYLTVFIADGSITFEKLQPNFLIPQTMVEPTSTGIIDQHYYGIPTPTRISDDLNHIRTEIRDIKGTTNWTDLLIGVRAENSQITKEYKTGAFLEIESGLETVLTSGGTALLVKKGSAIIGPVVKRMENDTIVALPPRNQHIVGDWTTRTNGEFNYVGAAPQTFYLAQTSTGSITVADVHIVRSLNTAMEFKQATDPYNPQVGDDYILFSSRGVVTTLTTGIMKLTGMYCFYSYYIPRIDTLVITSTGLEIRQSTEQSQPEPLFITSTGIFPLYHITRSSLVDQVSVTDVIDVRVPRLEIREIREVLFSDLAMYNDQYTFNPLSYYSPYKFSVINTSTGYLDNMDVWDFNTQNTYQVMHLSSTGIAQTMVQAQENDEIWLFSINDTSTGIQVQLDYTTSTGVYDKTTYGTIPRADAWDYVPTGYLLEKGLKLGYHKIRISCPTGTNTTSWYSSSNLNTARSYTAGCGTKATALATGGYSGSSALTSSEKFSGFTWTTNAGWNLSTEKRYHGLVGRQNSALSFGGATNAVPYSAVAERFNGSSWTSITSMSTGRQGVAGAGGPHSVLCFGGYTGSVSSVTEFFDGFSWSTLGALVTARYNLAGCGIKSAAISFGGNTGSVSDVTEKFNGTSWTATGSLTTARELLSGCGIQSSAVAFGGYTTTYVDTTSKFNGSTWSTSSVWSLNTARSGLGGAGIQSSAVSFGGTTGSVSQVTEKFINTNVQLYKLVVGKLDNYYDRALIYSQDLQSDNIQVETLYVDGTVTSDEAIVALINADMIHSIHKSTDITLGDNSDYLIPTEKAIKTYIPNYLDSLESTTTLSYSDDINTISIPLTNIDFPSVKLTVNNLQSAIIQNVWTTNPTWNLNTARYGLAGCGTVASTVSFGGSNLTPYLGVTEIFNGVAWSNSGSLIVVRSGLMGCGSQNSALSAFGYIGSATNATEKFNGNIWTLVSGSGTARYDLGGCGIQGAAISFGGTGGTTTIEKFNGAVWSAAGTLVGAKTGANAVGIQNAALITGGSSYLTSIEKYNGAVGSILATGGYLGIGRQYHAGSGILNAALVFGGNSAAATHTTTTEKYNGFHWSTDLNQVLSIARYYLSGCGTQNAAMCFGGISGATILATTEKFIGILPIKSYISIQSSTGSIYTTNIAGTFTDKSYEVIVYPPATIQLNALYNTWQTQEEYDQLSTLGLHVLYNNDVWTTSGNLNTARERLAGAGIQSAALSFGGYTGSNSQVTESFNGSVWTNEATAPLMTSRYGLAGCGIKNAALGFGGWESAVSAVTEKFNGTSWSATGNLNTARRILAGCGIQSAALSFGGLNISVVAVTTTEKFNGATWAVTGSLNIIRYTHSGAGSQSAGLAFGGFTSPTWSATEKFNGVTWVLANSLNVAQSYIAGCGVQSAALSFGGSVGYGATEKFNGISWSSSTNLNVGRYYLAGAGSQSSGLSFGGIIVAASAVTEKFISNPITNYNFPIRGVWSTSGNLVTARYSLAGCGTQSAALSFGGTTGSLSRLTEKFNGTAWTQTTPGWDLRSPGKQDHSGAGIQNAALEFGGYDTTWSAITEKFDGSTWTYSAGWNLTTARTNIAGCGIQSAALSFGGTGTLDSNKTEKFDGSSWTTNAAWNLNTAKWTLAGCGTQSAALSFGGTTTGVTYSETTEKFNGTTWSYTGSLNVARNSPAGCGTQLAAVSFGGINATGSRVVVTERFDGLTWAITGSLNTARNILAGAGSQSAGLSFGGFTGAASAVTEKYLNTSIVVYTSTWTASGALNTPRNAIAGAGIQTASVSFGGFTGALSAITETFNGTTWTNVAGAGMTARGYLGGLGIQTAALSFGGGALLSPVTTTEKFNGTVWSATGSLNTARTVLAGAGIQSAGLSFGGYTGGLSAVTETFNGSIWTAANSLNVAQSYIAGCGVQNAALSFSGSGGFGTTEKFDGVNWTTNASWNLNFPRYWLGGAGTQTVAVCFGGTVYFSDYQSTTEKFNGNSWSYSTNLNTARSGLGGAGTQAAGLSFGGYNGSYLGTTEKFGDTAPSNYAGIWTSWQPTRIGFWSTSLAILNTPRYATTGFGTQSAGVCVGGQVGGGGASNVTELFTGIAWGTFGGTNINPARWSLAACGSQSSGLCFGGTTGANSAVTDKFDGSNWTTNAGWNLVTARYALAGCGIQSAALSFGGWATAASGLTEKFNGSAWSATGSLNTGRYYIVGCGTQNAALSFGGTLNATPTPSAVTEKFDGLNWTVTNNLNFAKYGMVGCGTQNAALETGGTITGTTFIATTELFNGLVWYGSSSVSVVRWGLAGFGSQSFSTVVGGNNSGTTALNLTELYNSNILNDYLTPIQGTWTMCGDLNTYRAELAGCGVLASSLSFGGATSTGAVSLVSETFDGVNWTAITSLNTARRSLGGSGSKTAALSFGGTTTGSNYLTTVESFDGSTWTSITTAPLMTGRMSIAGCGILNATLAFGGYNGSYVATTEKFDGISWSATGDLNTARGNLAGAGTQSAALSFEGTTGSNSSSTEKFDGSTWTIYSDLNVARTSVAGCGSQSSALSFNGYSSEGSVGITEKFNGSYWSFSNNSNVAKYSPAGSGEASSALSFGGRDVVNYLGSTEKFSDAKFNITYKI
jgi:hypothetical protein